MWDSLLARDANLYHEAAFAIWRFDTRSRVGEIAIPTMVIIPELDTVVPVPTQEELASLLPTAEVVRIEGRGHEAILADPAGVAELVFEFLGATASSPDRS